MVEKASLIVDDDQKIVRLLRASLEQAGYQVFVAYDGETALHVLRRERPDLVVLDLMLPDRDGWDVTRVMRSDAILAHTPIIMGQQVEVGGSIEVAQVGQAFNDMTAALQEAETLRQNMVADVAHELRTPLTVLQGNLWAILNDTYHATCCAAQSTKLVNVRSGSRACILSQLVL